MIRKKIYVIIAILAIASAAGISYAVLNKGEVVAKIGDKPIYQSDIEARIKELKEANIFDNNDQEFDYASMDKVMKVNLIRSLIIGDLIEKEALAANIDNDPEFKKAFNFSITQLRQKVYIDKKAKSNVSENKVRQSYEQFSKEQASKDEFKIEQILTEDKAEIDKVAEQLKAGAKFEELAKKFNPDQEKEDASYFSLGQMPEELDKEIQKMQLKQVSQPIKTEFGWHIIKLVDKRKSSIPQYGELKYELREKLSQEYVKKYLEELLVRNQVKIIME